MVGRQGGFSPESHQVTVMHSSEALKWAWEEGMFSFGELVSGQEALWWRGSVDKLRFT